jgi:hypothetical protein
LYKLYRVVANFLVIEPWAVSDGLLAETAAHAALGDYRVNMNREFFQLPYQQLRNTIEKTIQPWPYS